MTELPERSYRRRFAIRLGQRILHPNQPRIQRFGAGLNVRAFGHVHFIGWW